MKNQNNDYFKELTRISREEAINLFQVSKNKFEKQLVELLESYDQKILIVLTTLEIYDSFIWRFTGPKTDFLEKLGDSSEYREKYSKQIVNQKLSDMDKLFDDFLLRDIWPFYVLEMIVFNSKTTGNMLTDDIISQIFSKGKTVSAKYLAIEQIKNYGEDEIDIRLTEEGKLLIHPKREDATTKMFGDYYQRSIEFDVKQDGWNYEGSKNILAEYKNWSWLDNIDEYENIYGFSAKNLIDVIFTLSLYVEKKVTELFKQGVIDFLDNRVISVLFYPKNKIVKIVSREINIERRKIEKILDYITFSKNQFNKCSLFPLNLEIYYKPLIRLSNNQYFVFPSFLINSTGELLAETSSKLGAQYSHEIGKNFEEWVRCNIPPDFKTVRLKINEGGYPQGDVDALSINIQKSLLIIIEAKYWMRKELVVWITPPPPPPHPHLPLSL